MRGGIGSELDLRPQPETRPPADPHPRPLRYDAHRRPADRNDHPAGKPFETAISPSSVSSDRTLLLSSRFSMRLRRFYEPASAAPSLCEFPCFLKPPSNSDRVRCDCPPWQPR